MLEYKFPGPGTYGGRVTLQLHAVLMRTVTGGPLVLEPQVERSD